MTRQEIEELVLEYGLSRAMRTGPFNKPLDALMSAIDHVLAERDAAVKDAGRLKQELEECRQNQ